MNSSDLVKGYWTLLIPNISAYETRSYEIVYKTPVAEAIIERYRRAVMNQTQYLNYPVKISGLASFPLDPLWIRFRHEDPFTCKDVDFVWLTSEETYLNPKEPQKRLYFECDGNDTIVHLEALSGPGEKEYINVFVVERKPGPMVPIRSILYNFLETLISLIRRFIEFISSFFT